MVKSLVHFSQPVRAALRSGWPVVALETALVSHGFSRPRGLQIASELEAVITAEGAVPALVGVLDGLLHIGLSGDGLKRLAEAEVVSKLNLSNLAAGIASGQPGATTVSATLFAAQLAGIRVLTTGGIGGVHRGASESGDVSADLTALARFPVAVVCAGAKAVLDLPRTLETLETLGVPVLGLRTHRFPAFYRRDSGLPVDRSFTDVADLAQAVRAHFRLGLESGVVVANPILPEHEMPRELYDEALERALAEAGEDPVRGRQVTPFLLRRLEELTEGRSSFSNRALLMHNAVVAAKLAAALQRARSPIAGEAPPS